MNLSSETKLMTGLTLILVPTIEYGGSFLLSVLIGAQNELGLNDLQKAFFRAGHAHAGVLVLLGLICQILADSARLPTAALWSARIGLVIAPMFISAGFFVSVVGSNVTQPNGFIALIYVGAVLLALVLITLGVGLLRNR
jgi:hypothetical protein